MKKQLNGFILGVLVSFLVMGMGITAFAAYQQQATLNYDNIKITLDGKQVNPTDANGTYVEPFTINGTTYLPVRAVANALGMSVGWNQDTKTVTLESSSTPQVTSNNFPDTYPDFSVPNFQNIVGWDACVNVYKLSSGDSISYTYDPMLFNSNYYLKGDPFTDYFNLLKYYGFKDITKKSDGDSQVFQHPISGIIVNMYPEDNFRYYTVLVMSLHK
jgi:hypothetical protein